MKRLLAALVLVMAIAPAAAAEPEGDAAVNTAPAPAATAEASTGLEVQVKGFRNQRGQLLVAVFDQKRGFPDEPERALRTRIVKVDGSTMTLRIPDLPGGEYAVSVVHDENENQKLDTNFFGVPREGFGTSNNVKPTLGAPSFKEARFSFAGGEKRIVIELIYY